MRIKTLFRLVAILKRASTLVLPSSSRRNTSRSVSGWTGFSSSLRLFLLLFLQQILQHQRLVALRTVIKGKRDAAVAQEVVELLAVLRWLAHEDRAAVRFLRDKPNKYRRIARAAPLQQNERMPSSRAITNPACLMRFDSRCNSQCNCASRASFNWRSRAFTRSSTGTSSYNTVRGLARAICFRIFSQVCHSKLWVGVIQ